MAIQVQNLDDIDADAIEQAFAFAKQLVLEQQPNVDTKRGVINQLVIGLDAILGAAQQTNIDLLRQSQSLQAIEENPTLADDDVVNAVLSNYRLDRRTSTPATGEVTIVLTQLLAVTITQGAIFEAEGQQFTSDATYAARTASANVLSDTDRLIVQIGEDQYAFTIDVTAVVAGSAGLLRKDTQLVPLAPPSSYLTSYAANDFAGGINAQTNQDLINLLQEGLAARAYSNRVTIPATIKNADDDVYEMVTDDFATIEDMSIVGFGDAEMLRDQHWLFPVSGGGRSDIYLRSQQKIQAVSLTRTAILVDKTTDGGIWQFSIARDEAPGFYEVSKIIVNGSSDTQTGYAVTSDIRGVDLTGDDTYTPDILTALEAVYSRYQAATIKFLDTDTDVSLLTENVDTQDYAVTVTTMPLVKEVQEFIGDRRVRNPAGDILVKGAIPCFLGLSFEIQRRRTDDTIDEDTIRNNLVSYVNKLGFPGRLYASALHRIIDEQLPDNVDAGDIDMVGRIRRPDGTHIHVRDTTVLVIPEYPTYFTSGRTVIFNLEQTDIAITINNVDVPEV